MHRIFLYLKLGWRFWRFYRRAHTCYDVHSPFLSRFTEAVLEDRRIFYAFPAIESLRERLRRDRTEVPVAPLGAGSQLTAGTTRSIADIVRYGAVPPWVGRWLFRVVQWQQPRTVLELGASLGISTLYLGAVSSRTRVVTIEGDPAMAARANRHFQDLGMPHLEVRPASFEEALAECLEDLENVDLLYIDGDHRQTATLAYFQQALPYMGPGGMVIIADIYWSEEMMAAWRALQRHPAVDLSVDLFWIGCLFFRPEQRHPRHYTLVPHRWKPWRLGFRGAAIGSEE